MTEPSDWSLLRSFLAVVRRGSLSAAARATGLTQPTVGRHIDELETGLGVALFTRSQAGLLPTAAATALLPHAEAMEAAFAALVRSARTGGDTAQPRGVVRISASEIVGTYVLPPILAGLRNRHPHIVIELVLNNRTDDLLRRDADIAVRMIRPKQDGLVARRLGSVPLGLYAHRDYIARFGKPETVEALGAHHVIGFDRDDHSARSVASSQLPISRELFSYRTDSDVAQVTAIEAGLGIGGMQTALARRNPSLVPVLADHIAFELDCWLAAHEDQKDSPPIRVMFDGLAEGLAEWISEGRA
ncbi:LysR family transcriptional regulator [Bradyrhizobium sp. HKCCYLR20261]|uniref:LysR family transcriptional regulator n=1 Tax=Bradyrhizobium sp. HKCCYLR20261 TaxID=3420760 RepID=UPI003EB69728